MLTVRDTVAALPPAAALPSFVSFVSLAALVENGQDHVIARQVYTV